MSAKSGAVVGLSNVMLATKFRANGSVYADGPEDRFDVDGTNRWKNVMFAAALWTDSVTGAAPACVVTCAVTTTLPDASTASSSSAWLVLP